MSKRRAKRYLVAGLSFLLCICLGCGTGGYEKQLEETVQRLGKESAFSGMHSPAQLPGTPVSVQLPGFFPQTPLAADSDPRRLAPPSLEVPDLKATHEGSITDSEGGKIPFYCYLAASEKDPERSLYRHLRDAFPTTNARWETADCTGSDGATRQWKLLKSAAAQQEFYYVNQQGQESFRSMECTVRFYVRKEGNWFVVVGWRVPTTIEKLIGQGAEQGEDLGLDQWAPRVAGSVKVEE